MVSALLGWSQCTFASKLDITNGRVTGDRETDAGSEKISFPLPAVVSADLRLNEPRYATLPNIMKAKKKPIETVNLADLGISVSAANKVVKVEEPATRKAGIFVESVDQLVLKLKTEASVI